MSIALMAEVWGHSKLSGTDLLLLLAIADHVNDDTGVAFPGIASLAKKMRLSERQTRYLLRKLERSGELEIGYNAGPKRCNIYRVKPTAPCSTLQDEVQHIRPCSELPPNPEAYCPQIISNHKKKQKLVAEVPFTSELAVPPKGRRKTGIPENWCPKESTVLTLRREFGLRVPEDVERYLVAFRDICQAKGYQYADFDAAFRNCVRQDWPKLKNSVGECKVAL
jgi:hypothetical protein